MQASSSLMTKLDGLPCSSSWSWNHRRWEPMFITFFWLLKDIKNKATQVIKNKLLSSINPSSKVNSTEKMKGGNICILTRITCKQIKSKICYSSERSHTYNSFLAIYQMITSVPLTLHEQGFKGIFEGWANPCFELSRDEFMHGTVPLFIGERFDSL